MRPRCGVAPSAGPPARPHPKLLGDGKGRRRGNPPLSHLAPQACRGAAWLRHDARPLWVTLGLQTAPSGPHEPPPRALTPPGLPIIASSPSRIHPTARGGPAQMTATRSQAAALWGGLTASLGTAHPSAAPEPTLGHPAWGGRGSLPARSHGGGDRGTASHPAPAQPAARRPPPSKKTARGMNNKSSDQ